MVEQHDRRHYDQEVAEHHLTEEIRLLQIETTIKALESKIDTISKDVSDLVSAWKAASWLVSAVKWVGTVAVAITAILALLKGIK